MWSTSAKKSIDSLFWTLGFENQRFFDDYSKLVPLIKIPNIPSLRSSTTRCNLRISGWSDHSRESLSTFKAPESKKWIRILPKQRFLVISQNWCGDFPPNLVITLNLLSSPQIQIFIEMWSISAKKSIDSLLGLWASKISDSYSASTALFGDFSKLVRRFSTKFGDHVKIALFTTNPNFYWNSSVISEEIHWSTFLDSGEQWICPKSLIIRIFDER